MCQNLSVKQWILIGALIRFVVAPITMHPDIFFIYKYPHLLSHGQWNIYEIAEKNFNTDYYPAITLFVFGIFDFIFGTLFSSYETFAHSLSTTRTSILINSKSIFSNLLMLKTPYFIFEAAIFIIGWKMTSDSDTKKKFAFLMATNPLIIYCSYMFGQFDLLPACFMFLAGYFALQKDREHFGSLALACGFMTKIFPIIFFPFFILVASKNIKNACKLTIYFLVPILFFYTILYSQNGNSLFFTFKMFSYNLTTGDSIQNLLLRFFQATVYAIISWHAFFIGRKDMSYTLLVKYFLAIYMAAYWGLSVHSTHYLIWHIPFFILLASFLPQWGKRMYILLAIVFLGGLRDRSSFIGLFAPLNPEFFLSFPSLKDITGFLFNQLFYDHTLNFAFKSYASLIIYWIFKDLFSKKNDPIPNLQN